ncbi:MAG: tRNA (guanosine(37)-N1)-methyltransferase TrmD [Planctomycetota bacterium]|jgi:tRNA (guanine37-N1)-methyltransferase
MKITILTLFPDAVREYLGISILDIASDKGLATYEVVNFRDYAEGVHRQVDDRPFGGGPGMVLMPGPIVEAVEAARESQAQGARTILLSPQGRRFDQSLAEELAGAPGLILVCGRYEGFDERIRTVLAPEEISVGDYVLAGGELPALAVTEAVVRLIPGVLGHEDSSREDSFSHGVLEGPQFTRPREFRGETVPEVLLSGDHAAIRAWRHEESLRRTRERRRDLLENSENSDAENRDPGEA